MPEPEEKTYDRESYRKPRKMAGIPLPLAKLVEKSAKQNGEDWTQAVRRLIRYGLEREQVMSLNR